MSNRPLPPEFEKWAHLPYMKFRGNGEWSSACINCGEDGHDPNSGDPDRFRMWETGYGKTGKCRAWCRSCGIVDWPDSDRESWSPERQQEARKLQREYANQERQRIADKITWLNEQSFWLGYHEAMTYEQRKLWYAEGIDDVMVEIHKLGYCDRYANQGAALSIPYWHSGTISTLQYRLLTPDPPEDKYRFQADTKATLFRPWPDDEIEGVVILIEGAKKAMVASMHGGHVKYKGKKITMVATPMKTTPVNVLKELDEAELILLLLDPDSFQRTKNQKESAIGRHVRLLGHDHCRVVNAPAKIDDMLMAGLKADAFEAMINQAWPWMGK